MERDGQRKKDEEFWFEDGTVILVAQAVEFRVFKGVLADHSPVFADMFSLPQPPEAASISCPVVHVTDTPEDLRHMLRVYMPKTDSSPFEPGDPSFDVISATIRLGHKYQIAKLVDHSIRYLKRFYTDDFNSFVKRKAPYGPPAFTAEHAIGVVNLARLVDEHSLLPTALLVCCTLGPEIVKGCKRSDGSREQLTLDDIGLCIGAKAKLTEVCIRNVIRIFNPSESDGCKTASDCRPKLRNVLRKLDKHAGQLSHPNPFISNTSLYGVQLKKSLCSSCWSMVTTRDNRERRHAWFALPALLGITAEGWPGEDGDKVKT
ncbi:hypothetical protein L226DRAFT_466593 [Lentinus tigrinus ALCF2SS1-7]|uniref:BTB domain-containing protein n=1 Tax=Lentinus tigrinus ALCF2SS1-6 TaxID=1328759 RepID=A0A5C2S4L5_9APHY|nr:hypothetical protein L227DRAFT_587012 [Lentinus tigrinus ALCF2SS1-6]RPD72827.1 hypothetical protein L226DRAFT_466593 [Lentinus tigrinus ALCF2SS1-7]